MPVLSVLNVRYVNQHEQGSARSQAFAKVKSYFPFQVARRCVFCAFASYFRAQFDKTVPVLMQLLFIEFRNHYAAFVTIDACFIAGVEVIADDMWQPVLPPVRLMADPHCEADAQAWHRLCLRRDNQPTRCVSPLRIARVNQSASCT